MTNNLLRIIILSAFFGCKTTEPPAPCTPVKSTGPILPLAVGNKWVYRYNGFDEQGNVKGGYQTLSYNVEFDTLMFGEKWFYSDGYQILKPDGIWGITSDTLAEQLYYKYPGNVGDTVFLIPNSFFTVIVSIDTVVTSPYGCFHAYEYIRNYGGGLELHDFYAPGIGRIKRESWSTNAPIYKSTEAVLVTVEIN